MGVAFSHGNAQWAYSSFNRFRAALGREIGIDLDKMCGFGGKRSWSKMTDPIIPLLHHSDCDGDLAPEVCATVAPRLRELVKDWPDDCWDKRKALELAEGMEDAAQNHERLIFQ